MTLPHEYLAQKLRRDMELQDAAKDKLAPKGVAGFVAWMEGLSEDQLRYALRMMAEELAKREAPEEPPALPDEGE